HRNLFRWQQHLRPLLRAFDDGLKRSDQAEEIDLDLRFVVVAGELGHRLVWAKPLRGTELLALVQQAGGRFELLVLEQAPYERVARIFFLAFDGRGRLRAWQQHLRLDVDKRRRHDEVVAGYVQVELLHQRNRVEILRRDQSDRDVVDIHLV